MVQKKKFPALKGVFVLRCSGQQGQRVALSAEGESRCG